MAETLKGYAPMGKREPVVAGSETADTLTSNDDFNGKSTDWIAGLTGFRPERRPSFGALATALLFPLVLGALRHAAVAHRM